VSAINNLIDRLNQTCKNALESAVGLCFSQSHFEVDIEHLLSKLIEMPNTDIPLILSHFDINSSKVLSDLSKSMDAFERGNTRNPSISQRVTKMLREAWLTSSIGYTDTQIRSGYILFTVLRNFQLSPSIIASSKEFNKISVNDLEKDLLTIISKSIESDEIKKDITTFSDAEEKEFKGDSALEKYAINLTENARTGKIDPVYEREEEVYRLMDILIRRRQNNPILTGEAGVGKTAIVEGFAIKIVNNDVPPQLRGVELYSLDLGLLQAGAGIKGEFENRLKSILKEIYSSSQPIIVFIDEAHTLIGAGAPQGAGDAANLLKPPLARGQLRAIAATTWAEYKKYFESDAALTRRFEVVKVDEPDEIKAVNMMRGIVPILENHHQVMIRDESIVEAVQLSRRYLTSRQLPDKSISVLDTACAKVAISMATEPKAIESINKKLNRIENEINQLLKENRLGSDHQSQIDSLLSEKTILCKDNEELKTQWEQEKIIVEQILALRKALTKEGETDKNKLKQYKDLELQLKKIQKESPLIYFDVNPQMISQVISEWTGIPTGRLKKNEIDMLLSLENYLKQRIIGQDHAIEFISRILRTSYAGIEDPSKPTGVFLFAGPSGVGKTETALALSDAMFGGEEYIISLNMTEYKESFSISLIKGSPPGYVGYKEGGRLTEAVRKRPYSVILLDEIDKAHDDVIELFYQVFDRGILEDGEGRKIDFRNTVIIMTSNLGANTITKYSLDEETCPTPQAMADIIREEMEPHFNLAFLGRLQIVPFFPISNQALEKIIQIKLDSIVKRIKENKNIDMTYEKDIISIIKDNCNTEKTGARNIDPIINNQILPHISKELLTIMANNEIINNIHLTHENNEFLIKVDKL